MFAFRVFFLLPLVAGNLLTRFEEWISIFKVEIKSGAIREKMFEKWESNDRYIEEHNAKNSSFQLGHNQFSGMDSDDFYLYLGYLNENTKLNTELSGEDATEFLNAPLELDWVEKGAVTGVKDQGQCGSCWSFSTTGALEGAYYIKYGDLKSFSEQQLVDCDSLKNGGKDHGCNGGLMDNAFSWISKNGGLCTEDSYPYVSGVTTDKGDCKTSCSIIGQSKVTKYVDVKPSSDADFVEALSKQPLSIAIEADQREFQLYKSGIFTGTCGTTLDHGVLAVGYGSDFYKVKNSWGVTWGQNGYILLGRGSQYNNGDGQCGILLQASYPVL